MQPWEREKTETVSFREKLRTATGNITLGLVCATAIYFNLVKCAYRDFRK